MHCRDLGLGTTLIALGIALACASPRPPLAVAEDFELDRYLGTWYEIASFPNRFQRGCVATEAAYSLRDDGQIRVVNSCRDGSFDGDLRRIEGVAWVASPEESFAKLEVQFFWPFAGDYWVLAVGDDYRWALVGDPSREYLWILSRTRRLDASAVAEAKRIAAARGFDVDRLQTTPQPAAEGE
jgi:apolipoprotein D and lipocalin family protein